MAIPTPEQIRVYRHRKTVWMVVQIACVPLSPLTAGALLSIAPKNGEIAVALAFGGVIAVVAGMLLFRYLYYRCPVCDHGLGRGGSKYIKAGEFFKGHCNNCGADYAA